MRDTLGAALCGVVLGFSLSRIGFASWDEVHRMFVFADLRLFLAFAFGVSVLAVAWLAAARVVGARVGPPRRLHPGTIAGGVLFGAGWAIAGACPGIALVQIGEGQLGALWTFGGMMCGNWLYSHIHERFFRWPVQACSES